MFDPQNLDSIGVIIEPNAIIADAQSKLRRIHTLKTFDISLSSLQEASNTAEDVHRGFGIYGPHVGFGARGPRKLLGHAYRLTLLS